MSDGPESDEEVAVDAERVDAAYRERLATEPRGRSNDVGRGAVALLIILCIIGAAIACATADSIYELAGSVIALVVSIWFAKLFPDDPPATRA